MDAFQENLSYNITLDLSIAQNKLANSPVGPACMDALHAIQQSAALPLRKTKRAVQAAALNNARKKISEFIASHKKKSDVADEMMNRYQVYFSTFCDGNLFERDKKPLFRMDATNDQDTPELKQIKDRKVKYADRRDDPLFAHEPSMNDIEQKYLGDCYLQAGVSSLVMNNPTAIKECMQDNGNGTVTVRFYLRYQEMAPEAQLYLDHPSLSRMWSAKASKNMSDKDLIFKLLQSPEAANSKKELMNRESSLSAALESYMDQLLETKIREKGLTFDQNQKSQLKNIYLASFRNTIRNTEIYQKAANVERTLRLADKLAQNKEIQDQVLSYMRTCLTQPNINFQQVYTECLFRLYALFPMEKDLLDDCKDLEPSSLDTPELRTLLAEQQQESKNWQKQTADRFVPLYVTVTKEVPVLEKRGISGEEEDAYTADALWMQLLEKAYAASGLHTKNPSNNTKIKVNRMLEEKTELRKKELEAAGMSGDELQRNLNEYRNLLFRKWLHSFEGIEGGQSGSFLERLTGKKDTTKELRLMDADSFTNTYFKKQAFHEQLQQTTGINIPTNIIANIMQDFTSENSWLSERSLTAIRSACSSHAVTMQELSDKVSKCMSDMLHNNDSYHLFHRPMSGAYTPYAEKTFEQIKQNLQNKVPVSVGTIKFLPPGVQASGRNGESEQSGLCESHAYSVVGTTEVDGKYFVQLRNPWATGEMGYVQTLHSDGSTSYSSRSIESDTKGVFNIELNHLLSRIDLLSFSG